MKINFAVNKKIMSLNLNKKKSKETRHIYNYNLSLANQISNTYIAAEALLKYISTKSIIISTRPEKTFNQNQKILNNFSNINKGKIIRCQKQDIDHIYSILKKYKGALNVFKNSLFSKKNTLSSPDNTNSKEQYLSSNKKPDLYNYLAELISNDTSKAAGKENLIATYYQDCVDTSTTLAIAQNIIENTNSNKNLLQNKLKSVFEKNNSTPKLTKDICKILRKHKMYKTYGILYLNTFYALLSNINSNNNFKTELNIITKEIIKCSKNDQKKTILPDNKNNLNTENTDNSNNYMVTPSLNKPGYEQMDDMPFNQAELNFFAAYNKWHNNNNNSSNNNNNNNNSSSYQEPARKKRKLN
ncbi:MAG: hypothetical protein GY730_00740 [bacterium]|nr:hypothetical protein [bacterium]